MGKKLEDMLQLLPEARVTGDTEVMIVDIVYDSRKAAPGALFFCLRGHNADGHNYIPQAVERGAKAVVIEKDAAVPEGVTVIMVPDTREAMQRVTPWYFDFPGRDMRMIGVTGTNGKTTTTHLIKSILDQAGYKTGLIGTIHTLIGDKVIPVRNTTPDVVDLQATLAQMRSEGIQYVVMEVSSHALALGRTAGCEFDVGVFTNLTRDHLDFHQTFENYAAAKAKLFKMLNAPDAVKGNKAAVINADDASGRIMLDSSSGRNLTYGLEGKRDFAARDIDVRANGSAFVIQGLFGDIPLSLKITGIFNVYNVLAAVGAAYVEGIGREVIKAALEGFTSVAGRFELVDAGQPFSVIVDYAHTPDGLENILKTARQIARNRIIVVFGCGGDRDRTKRPIMGRLAAEYGDIVIATSDNPRTEDPVAILKEIETGIKEGIGEGKDYEIIPERRDAIKRALTLAEADDIVIIAGKGHETYQILKDRTIPFDDRAVAREIIREMI